MISTSTMGCEQAWQLVCNHPHMLEREANAALLQRTRYGGEPVHLWLRRAGLTTGSKRIPQNHRGGSDQGKCYSDNVTSDPLTSYC